ncbi:MAG: RIP metalloprotease RseP [Deltaproteobacteria bacterium]|nr:RIP metalloprotease RseP [Deltaproteobacteria bacterium]MBW1951620.1 RIP metalloprotease RseP [Deltaproteobacteria bacterium]MBW1986637.1 RIP metalloprotease RseP [Deltaproteobacteria bacterium]MBW2134762.1 RIP metalloprotease RseP [Deltaproteobacteria bacterium]
MTTVLATIVVIGILIFVHELGHFLVAKWYGVGVEVFSLGFPPKLLHKQIGETDYRLSVIPLGGYVRMVGENPREEIPEYLIPKSFSNRPLRQRTAIVAAGPLFNLFFSIVALTLTFSFTGIPYFTTEIGGVQPDSPAAEAGLQPGDRILRIDQQPVERWEEMARMIRQSGEKPLDLTIQRGEEKFRLTLTPRRLETSNIFGEKVSEVLIGVAVSNNPQFEQVNPLFAFWRGVTYTAGILEVTTVSVVKLITQKIPLKSLGGPIMIAQVAGQQAEMGVSNLIHFMAVLSVNLALLNILPIPMLDGGHLFFFLLEAIRGKPIKLKHREMAQSIGLMIILVLMFVVFYNDIMRLLGPSQP